MKVCENKREYKAEIRSNIQSLGRDSKPEGKSGF
jgi:hypothetical protein